MALAEVVNPLALIGLVVVSLIMGIGALTLVRKFNPKSLDEDAH